MCFGGRACACPKFENVPVPNWVPNWVQLGIVPVPNWVRSEHFGPRVAAGCNLIRELVPVPNWVQAGWVPVPTWNCACPNLELCLSQIGIVPVPNWVRSEHFGPRVAAGCNLMRGHALLSR